MAMITGFVNTIELWFLDLFIHLLSHPGVVRFLREKFYRTSIPRLFFIYGVVFSVFGIMGFISGYVFIVLQMFGSR